MTRMSDLRVKIFADGADRAGIVSLAADPLIKGFTTNPTLMHAAGLRDYEAFARDVLTCVGDRPISFEVFSDDFDDMERQALKIAAWGDGVYVKIPVTNCSAVSAAPLIRRLAELDVKLNVTALMTLDQVEEVAACLAGGPPSVISVFAGRIADTGRDPVPIMAAALDIVRRYPKIELLWASPREILNVVQADEIGCDIITVTHDLLKKLPMIGYDLARFSLDTVKMFFTDAQAAGFSL
ncbi:MAG TPA: transaldolase [Acidimicrobiales bacterium]|nr:transaldolase [Acidimicrobiales bacterium]